MFDATFFYLIGDVALALGRFDGHVWLRRLFREPGIDWKVRRIRECLTNP